MIFDAAAPLQQPEHPSHDAIADTRPVTLLPDIQGVHFPMSTRREEAQKFFDQGLARVKRPDDIGALVRARAYRPVYPE